MSVREGWNFHNDIALPIEHKMRRYFGEQYDHYADSIEGGEFINSLEKFFFSNKPLPKTYPAPI